MKRICICLVFLFFLAGCASKMTMVSLTAEEQFNVAKKEYQQRKYDEAMTEFYKVIFNHPGAGFIDSAQFYLGSCYYRTEDYSLAIAEFKKLLSIYPTSLLADDAEYYIPLCNYFMSLGPTLDQENTQLAIEGFTSFLDYYPESPYVPRAKRYLSICQNKLAEKTYRNGCIYVKLGQYQPALIYLNEVLDKYRDTEWAGRSLFEIGEIYQKQGEPSKALEKYKELVNDFPENERIEETKKRIAKLEGKS